MQSINLRSVESFTKTQANMTGIGAAYWDAAMQELVLEAVYGGSTTHDFELEYASIEQKGSSSPYRIQLVDRSPADHGKAIKHVEVRCRLDALKLVASQETTVVVSTPSMGAPKTVSLAPLAPKWVNSYGLTGEGITVRATVGDNCSITVNEKTHIEGKTCSLQLTPFGTILTAPWPEQDIVDERQVLLTVILPNGRCPSALRSISIETVAVRTTERLHFAGPDALTGQLQNYSIFQLSGVAWHQDA